MDFVREHLTTKKNVNFEDNQERSNNIELEVLADTVYLEVEIILYTLFLVPRETVSFVFPRVSMFPETKSGEISRLEGKQTSLCSEGTNIKCFVIHPKENSRNEGTS